MLGPLLVVLADEFDTSIAVAGQLAAVTFITWGITAPLVGPVSDTYGRRPVLLAGLVILTIGVLGSATAWSYNSLLAFRLLTGIGAAMVLPTLMATVADILPAADRGRGVGFLAGSSWVGVAIGVPAVALLGDAEGWRLPFYITRPLANKSGADVGAAPERRAAGGPEPGFLLSIQERRSNRCAVVCNDGQRVPTDGSDWINDLFCRLPGPELWIR